ncbi:MAG: hypothetical protein K6E36_08380 [Oscillospiraceae bacterium]|nr:hypothetical protein [Oscillospiraceae bacterium]
MPSEMQQSPQRTAGNAGRRRKRRRRRGPAIRFRFGFLCFIWIAVVIGSFLYYMIVRNVDPDRDVFVTKKPKAESSVTTTAQTATGMTAASGSGQAQQTTRTTATGESSQVVVQAKINPVPEGQPKPASYLEECAFVGDMLIHRLGESGLLQKKNVYASEKLNLFNYKSEYILLQDGTTIRILSALSRAQCPIYLMFGTEDLAAGNRVDETTANFTALLNSVIAGAPSAPVYVLSIPPVTAAAEKLKKGAVRNSDIDLYNSNLLELANRANVYFIDTNTALKNSEGRLDPALAEQDGIHLNKEAGQKLLSYVLSHVPAA